MKNILVFVGLLELVLGNGPDIRIVGGEKAAPGQFPYIGSLRTISGEKKGHVCGACIIGRRVLVTSAHCEGSGDLGVLVGTTNQKDPNAKLYKVQKYLIHEDYEVVHLVNDVALVILSEDIEFNDLVKPIPLANSPPADGELLTVAGWGREDYYNHTFPNDLKWLQTHVLSKKACGDDIKGFPLEGKICTINEGRHGICMGDSGGPLVNNENKLVGIGSGSMHCAMGRPDIFTEIAYYKDWILKNAKSFI